MANRKTLVQYEDLLVQLLDSDKSPAQIIEALKSATALADYSDYIATFDEDMIAVGKALVGKWSERTRAAKGTADQRLDT